jgi:dephospho-CoA kinase
MRRWVVTGPAGGGKSTFCRLLARRGAVILDGDRLGHEVLDSAPVRTAVVAEFGPDVLTGEVLDRQALSRVVFAEPAALRALNRITHPPLADLMSRRLQELEDEKRHRLAVLEAAVYFLLPPVRGIEKVITVTAPAAIRLARLTGPGGLNQAEARSRIAAQDFMAADWATADIVLGNEGTLTDLECAADALWSRLDD